MTSIVEGPEAATHDVPSRLKPDATVSAKVDTKFDGDPMRAKKRGWIDRDVHGSTSSKSRSNAASGSPGASGASPPRTERSAAASPTTTGGWESSVSR